MVLMHWIERGLGQILAPDKNYKPDPDTVDTRSEFWTLVAPDPNFEDVDGIDPNESPSSSMTTTGFMSPSLSRGRLGVVNENRNILMTPPPINAGLRDRSHSLDDGTITTFDEVDARVLITAKILANCMASPPMARKKVDVIFRYCASTIPLNETNQAKLQKLLSTEKQSIFKTRCSKMGNMCPDGYTLMMAAAHTNHVVAAQILWQIGPPDQLKETNLQGKTPYHIAAENGNMEILQFLQQKYIETYGIQSPPPIDLTGMTPLGIAITSPVPNAMKQKQALYKQLFSPSDVSILGSPPPIQERVTYNTKLRIVYGVSQMPGKRIFMEDSSVASCWEDSAAIFAVCDGHSDSGQVSRFVAESFPSKFQKILKKYNFKSNKQRCDDTYWDTICKEVCMSTDERLKESNLPGGSTAVVAIVTNHEIVCANVGDCRCILIQKRQQNSALVEESLDSSPAANINEKEMHENDKNQANTTTDSVSLWNEHFVVIPLSDDHKANTIVEETRVHNAGLQIIQETFNDSVTGKDVTISKVALTDKDRMACSRSFGDFEYKANTRLGPEEQAVVAVPDVIVKNRTPNDTPALLVLACDGVWDVMTNDEVGQFVVETLEECLNSENTSHSTALPTVGDQLLKECFKRGSEDNLSCIVVALDNTVLMDTVLSNRVNPYLEGKALDFTPVTN